MPSTMLVTQIEQYKNREKKIGFEVLIETALGMANVEAIAQASRRLEAVADYAAPEGRGSQEFQDNMLSPD